MRPKNLATDNASALDMLIHATIESEKFYKVSKGAMGVVTADGSVLEIQSVQLPGRKVITAQQLMLNYPEILSLRLT